MARRAFLDLETTGVDPYTDRIVEIGIATEGSLDDETPDDSFVSLVNPGRPIPSDATAIHGISDSDVEDAPSFRDIAGRVQALLAGAVLVTYNGIRFDTVLIDRELRDAGEVGLERDDRGRIAQSEIDLFALWRNAEPRDLATAVRRFADAGIEHDAHSAAGDIDVLSDVLYGMTNAFGLPSTDEELIELSRPSWLVDRDGKFRRRDDGRIVFAFGKHRDELATDHLDYLEWMVGKDFTPETLSWAMDILAGSVL